MINREFQEITDLICDDKNYAFVIDCNCVLILCYSEIESLINWNILYDGEELTEGLEFEDYLLGGLFDNYQVIGLFDLLDLKLFKDGHAVIFETVLELFYRSEEISSRTVSEQLNKIGQLDQCGGYEYLKKIEDIYPRPHDLAFIARIFSHFKNCKRNFKLFNANDAVELEKTFELEKTTIFKEVEKIMFTKLVLRKTYTF
jgi:replicative DNA helicase